MNEGANYISYAQSAEMSLSAGFYNGGQTLEISTPEPNSIIYYTTNGDEPATTSSIYVSPISISSTQVVKAISVSSSSNISRTLLTPSAPSAASPHP